MLNTRRLSRNLVLAVLCFAVPQLRANVTPVTRGHAQGGVVLPAATTDVRVLRERLTVDVTPVEKKHATPLVSVVAEYELRHDGAEAVELDVAFPLAGAFEETFRPFGRAVNPRMTVGGLGYEVTLDGAAVAARDEPLPVPPTARSATPWVRRSAHWGRDLRPPNEAEQARLTAGLTRWVAADAELSAALAEYARIAPSDQRYNRVRQSFEDEAGTLLTRKQLAHHVDVYLRDPGDFSAICELIAEADPARRKQVGQNPGHYVSAVPQSPQPDAATVAAYRRTIDAWLATRPALAQRHAELVGEYDVQKRAREFVASRIAAHLRARGGLSGLAVARLVTYFEQAYNPHYVAGGAPKATTLPTFAPDEWLAAQLDPEVERERQRRIAEADELLGRFGFDATFLSPLTGLGYDRRVGWRDSSTWPLLKLDAPALREEQLAMGRHSFTPNTYAEQVTSPRSEAKLIRFAVPLRPGQTRTLRVAYRALAEVDEIELGKGYAAQVVHVRYILKTARNWKSFGPIDLTVTLPKSGLVVMEPAPPGPPRDVEGGRVAYDVRVENPEGNLRVAWMPATAEAASAIYRAVTPADLPDLRILESVVEHPQARRVLAALVALADRPDAPQSGGSELRRLDNLMRAGFSTDEAIPMAVANESSRAFAVRELTTRHAHVLDLADVGWRDHDSVFRHHAALPGTPSQPIWQWPAEDRRVAADWIARMPGGPPTPAARLARAYVVLLGTAQPAAAQFAEFLDAARADAGMKHVALMLVAHFPRDRDPRGMAPLAMEVLEQPRPTSTVPDPLPHNTYVAAVNAFQHGAAGPLEDALRVLERLDDHQAAASYRVGALYGPEIGFDRMRAICERLVRSPKDAHPDNWILVLNKINPTRTRDTLAAWAKQGLLEPAAAERVEERLRRGQ